MGVGLSVYPHFTQSFYVSSLHNRRCVFHLSGRKELRSLNRPHQVHKMTFIRLLLKFLLITYAVNIPTQRTIDILWSSALLPHLDQESHLCMAEIYSRPSLTAGFNNPNRHHSSSCGGYIDHRTFIYLLWLLSMRSGRLTVHGCPLEIYFQHFFLSSSGCLINFKIQMLMKRLQVWLNETKSYHPSNL